MTCLGMSRLSELKETMIDNLCKLYDDTYLEYLDNEPPETCARHAMVKVFAAIGGRTVALEVAINDYLEQEVYRTRLLQAQDALYVALDTQLGPAEAAVRELVEAARHVDSAFAAAGYPAGQGLRLRVALRPFSREVKM